MCNLTYLIAIVFATIGIPVSLGQHLECQNNTLLGNESEWKCVKRAKCVLANTISVDREVPCGANKICCPKLRSRSIIGTGTSLRPVLPSNITRPSRAEIDKANLIALHKCYEYQNYVWHNYTEESVIIGEAPLEKHVLDCHETSESLIAGGSDVREKEYPHMALLGYDENVEYPNSWRCGGSLISEQFILSAAHCAKIGKKMEVKWALLGKLDRRDISMNLKNKNLFRIVQNIIHPHYKVGSSARFENNDIALYKLKKPIKLSSSIRPICLYHDQQTTTSVGARAVVPGWGLHNPDYKESGILQKAAINIVDKQKCVDQFKNDPGLQDGFDSTTMICADGLTGRKDSFLSDSGAPLLVPLRALECMYLQLGVATRNTWDYNLSVPTIYTNVSYYLPWIQSVVWPTE